MNYHSDEWIMSRLQEHYEEAKTLVPEQNIVGIFIQGSQNYGLDYESSDIDTKCIVTPTLDDLIYNRAPMSTTHVRANKEHIDMKDIRLYVDCFKKQNINFVEILFTKYKIINPMYADLWKVLEDNAEAIARMSIWKSLKCMKGTAGNKFVALEHPYPSKLDILDKCGYDPKQLHHLFRIKYFTDDYISGKPYSECLISEQADFLKEVKKGKFGHTEAKALAETLFDDVAKVVDNYCDNHEIDINTDAENVLMEAQHDIMLKSIQTALLKGENNEKD